MSVKKTLQGLVLAAGCFLGGEFYANNVNPGAVSPTEAVSYASHQAGYSAFPPARFAGSYIDRYARHGGLVSIALGAGMAAGGIGALVGPFRKDKNEKKKEE